MSEEELQFYKEIIYAVKVFDVNFQNISKELYKEIKRLNNIIDEIEKFVSVGTYIEQDAHLKAFGVNENFIRGEAILKKIQELKDSDK